MVPDFTFCMRVIYLPVVRLTLNVFAYGQSAWPGPCRPLHSSPEMQTRQIPRLLRNPQLVFNCWYNTVAVEPLITHMEG